MLTHCVSDSVRECCPRTCPDVCGSLAAGWGCGRGGRGYVGGGAGGIGSGGGTGGIGHDSNVGDNTMLLPTLSVLARLACVLTE